MEHIPATVLGSLAVNQRVAQVLTSTRESVTAAYEQNLAAADALLSEGIAMLHSAHEATRARLNATRFSLDAPLAGELEKVTAVITAQSRLAAHLRGLHHRSGALRDGNGLAQDDNALASIRFGLPRHHLRSSGKRHRRRERKPRKESGRWRDERSRRWSDDSGYSSDSDGSDGSNRSFTKGLEARPTQSTAGVETAESMAAFLARYASLSKTMAAAADGHGLDKLVKALRRAVVSTVVDNPPQVPNSDRGDGWRKPPQRFGSRISSQSLAGLLGLSGADLQRAISFTLDADDAGDKNGGDNSDNASDGADAVGDLDPPPMRYPTKLARLSITSADVESASIQDLADTLPLPPALAATLQSGMMVVSQDLAPLRPSTSDGKFDLSHGGPSPEYAGPVAVSLPSSPTRSSIPVSHASATPRSVLSSALSSGAPTRATSRDATRPSAARSSRLTRPAQSPNPDNTQDTRTVLLSRMRDPRSSSVDAIRARHADSDPLQRYAQWADGIERGRTQKQMEKTKQLLAKLAGSDRALVSGPSDPEPSDPVPRPRSTSAALTAAPRACAGLASLPEDPEVEGQLASLERLALRYIRLEKRYKETLFANEVLRAQKEHPPSLFAASGQASPFAELAAAVAQSRAASGPAFASHGSGSAAADSITSDGSGARGSDNTSAAPNECTSLGSHTSPRSIHGPPSASESPISVTSDETDHQSK
ncbi:uncharacterized protein AMSG_10272 [Thecamonas trahens ATCC 50062]|uniref:Uncharacterized protein n=1 Tax=Thecamonas trahens ATCC 50062 TaxID=461836 RepID=A0A0L0DS64_THETB|nr:hypothetical protein AMSG_10272 [Thecamonas trahens ATCC 50062]KNC54293.1 hypothetical protein AMSG_10272 [Thecamonas trahens ATCC 50062]|eukprot:XP_013753758.1 hypothetical protein AMSG_10272 [Thecamonas trahens ATCC 50062]